MPEFPELKVATHLPGLRRALAVLPHPDDESWAMGGLLTRLRSAGVETHLLCLTRGEAGGAPDVRMNELTQACNTLDLHLLKPQHWLPDGRVIANDVQREVARLLQDIAPQALLLFDETGAYGHRDHIAASLGALCAAAQAAPHRPHIILTPRFPPAHFNRLRRFLQRHRPELLHPSAATEPAAPGAPQALPPDATPAQSSGQGGSVALSLRLSPSEHSRKLAALRAHRSQHRPGPHGPRFLFDDTFESLLEHECHLLRNPNHALASFT